jgi:hypothetical protein
VLEEVVQSQRSADREQWHRTQVVDTGDDRDGQAPARPGLHDLTV